MSGWKYKSTHSWDSKKCFLPHNPHVYVACLASKHLPCPFLPPTPGVPANIVHTERNSQVRILKFSLVFFKPVPKLKLVL